MKTSRGIYININESDYKLQVGDFEFYFSSTFYLEKFKQNYKNYIKNENAKINIKYHINIDLTNALLFSYYKIIEKRGFKVIDLYNNKKINETDLTFFDKVISYGG